MNLGIRTLTTFGESDVFGGAVVLTVIRSPRAISENFRVARTVPGCHTASRPLWPRALFLAPLLLVLALEGSGKLSSGNSFGCALQATGGIR